MRTLTEACRCAGIGHPYTFAELGRAVEVLTSKCISFDTSNEPHIRQALAEHRRVSLAKVHNYMGVTAG